jgi:putative inorganic carbon (HCO3(-)) transporter
MPELNTYLLQKETMILSVSSRVKEALYFTATKTGEWSLIFLIAAVPLIVNPKAYDYWYQPKIESVYALIIIAGFAWFVKAMVKDKSFCWKSSPLTIPLLLYTTAFTLSTLFSIDFKRSLNGDIFRCEGLYALLAYVSLVVLFINQVNTLEMARKLFVGLIVCSVLVSLYGLFQYVYFDPTAHFIIKYLPARAGIASTIGNSNFLGKYLVLVIPLVVSFYLNGNSFMMRFLLFAALLVCLAALVLTFTRASWLSMVLGFSLFLFLAFRNRLLNVKKRRFISLGILLVGTIFFLNSYSAENSFLRGGRVYERISKVFKDKKSKGVATRLFVWKRALPLIKEKTWLGHGAETFEIAFKKDNRDYIETFNDYVSIDRAHNNYIDNAFSHGLIGLGAYLAVIIAFLMHMLNLLKNASDDYHKLLYVGIISGYCGYLFNDMFIFSVVSVSPTFWSLMGLSIAQGRLEHSEKH